MLTIEDLLIELEGLRTHVYLDSGGAPTIGIGHRLTRSERTSGKIRIGQSLPVPCREGLSEAQCRDLLYEDLQPCYAALGAYAFSAQLQPRERIALLSFIFNVGVGAFEQSTLLRRLQALDFHGVPGEMRRWIYDNGVVVEGLRRRREIEIAVWEGKVDIGIPPHV